MQKYIAESARKAEEESSWLAYGVQDHSSVWKRPELWPQTEKEW